MPSGRMRRDGLSLKLKKMNLFLTEIVSWLVLAYLQFSSVQSLSRARLFATPWTVACQASLSVTNSQSLLKLMSVESVMAHLALSRLALTPGCECIQTCLMCISILHPSGATGGIFLWCMLRAQRPSQTSKHI